MSDERMTEEELDEENGEALPDREALSAVRPFSDPDLDVTLDPPKEWSEPGLPPPARLARRGTGRRRQKELRAAAARAERERTQPGAAVIGRSKGGDERAASRRGKALLTRRVVLTITRTRSPAEKPVPRSVRGVRSTT